MRTKKKRQLSSGKLRRFGYTKRYNNSTVATRGMIIQIITISTLLDFLAASKFRRMSRYLFFYFHHPDYLVPTQLIREGNQFMKKVI